MNVLALVRLYSLKGMKGAELDNDKRVFLDRAAKEALLRRFKGLGKRLGTPE